MGSNSKINQFWKKWQQLKTKSTKTILFTEILIDVFQGITECNMSTTRPLPLHPPPHCWSGSSGVRKWSGLMPPLAASLVACAFSSISLLDTSDIYKTKKCIQHKEATRYARNYVQLMQNFIDVMKQTFSVYLTIIRKKNICFITSKMSATFLIFFLWRVHFKCVSVYRKYEQWSFQSNMFLLCCKN